MTHSVCTILDKGFLFRGVALIQSFQKTSEHYMIWVVCLDDIAYDALETLAIEHVVPIRVSDIEHAYPNVLEIKHDRTIAEYAWTLKSFSCRYLFEHKNISSILFLDADFYSYGPLQHVFDEIGDASIAIVPHRFSPEKKYLEKKMGIFNAGFVYFRNDVNGNACLQWWSDRVLEWCFARYENGKNGDQMYLDAWPKQFSGVRSIEHKGIDAAPWNIAHYTIQKSQNSCYIENDELLLFHFHGLVIVSADQCIDSHRFIPSKHVQQYIYTPYKQAIRDAILFVHTSIPSFHYGYKSISCSNTLYLVFARFFLGKIIIRMISAIRNWIVVRFY